MSLSDILDESQYVNNICTQFFGFEAKIQPMIGYEVKNYRVTNIKNDQNYILKISEDLTERSLFEGQNAALFHLEKNNFPYRIPSPVPGLSGDEIYQVPSTTPGQHFLVRMYSYLPGSFLNEIKSLSLDQVSAWGALSGHMSQALSHFDHPGIRRYTCWDLRHLSDFSDDSKYIKNSEIKNIVDYFLARFDPSKQKLSLSLPMGPVHNDLNEQNILADSSQKSRLIHGVIDFGDMVWSFRLLEAAVSMAYCLLKVNSVQDAVVSFLNAHHGKASLTPEEVKWVYPFAILRLCQSLMFSSKAFAHQPDNDYLLISQAPASECLKKAISICPDKMSEILLNAAFPNQAQLQSKISKAKIIDDRRRNFSKNLGLSYKKPLLIRRGSMQYLFDECGDSFLDTVNNISHVGHCHPALTREISNQIYELNTNTRYLNEHLTTLSNQLLSTFPKELDCCFIVCTGSEANELAIRLSRSYTGRKALVALDGAYHGNTWQLIQLSPYKHRLLPDYSVDPSMSRVATIPLNASQMQNLNENLHRNFQELLDDFDIKFKNPQKAAGLIHESILSCAGQIELPKNYLKQIYQIVKGYGGLCIADEIQTGFGRTGTHFWSFEREQVIPDIVTIGKSMGNGHPVAAVVTRKEIADCLDSGMEYFNSFGGNPVSCIAAISVLNILDQESLQKNAKNVGQTLKSKLLDLKNSLSHGILTDVRGDGFFLGIEFSDQQKCQKTVEYLHQNRILSSADGVNGNVIKFKPPMCFNQDNSVLFQMCLETSIHKLV